MNEKNIFCQGVHLKTKICRWLHVKAFRTYIVEKKVASLIIGFNISSNFFRKQGILKYNRKFSKLVSYIQVAVIHGNIFCVAKFVIFHQMLPNKISYVYDWRICIWMNDFIFLIRKMFTKMKGNLQEIAFTKLISDVLKSVA